MKKHFLNRRPYEYITDSFLPARHIEYIINRRILQGGATNKRQLRLESGNATDAIILYNHKKCAATLVYAAASYSVFGLFFVSGFFKRTFHRKKSPYCNPRRDSDVKTDKGYYPYGQPVTDDLSVHRIGVSHCIQYIFYVFL